MECLDGDPDRPLVIGSVYNPQDIPPYSAGQDSSANHAGTVSGLHSRGIDGADSHIWSSLKYKLYLA